MKQKLPEIAGTAKLPIKIILPNYRSPSWNTIYSSRSIWTRKRVVDNVHKMVQHYASMTIKTPLTYIVDIHVDAYFSSRPYDSDNIPIKLFVDGLKSIAFANDDRRFVHKTSSLSHVDRSNPRVEITLTPAPLPDLRA